MSHEEIDWVALDQYVAGEGSSDEREIMRRRIQASPVLTAIIAAMRNPLRASEESEARSSSAVAWHELSARAGIVDERRLPSAHIRLHERRASRHVPDCASRLRTRRSDIWRAIVGLGLAAAVAGVWFAHAYSARTQVVGLRTLVTGPGESATHIFSDGTRVMLAPSSTLKYPSTFGTSAREMTLEGEAYFDVVHDPQRPLRVRTKDVVALDLGTTFVVRAYAGSQSTQIVVASGTVALRDRADHPIGRALGRGEMADINRGTMMVRAVDVAAYTAWTQGRIAFENAPVADVLTELSRWLDLDVSTPDASLAARRVTASFARGAADDVLDGLANVLRARVVRHGRSAQLIPVAAVTVFPR
jgi:transmembrane sensor